MDAVTVTASRARYVQPTVTRFLATFGYAWFTIGLFTGTLVLVVAVRGILDVLQRLGWEQTAQNRLLIGVMLVFVVVSFLIARRVVRYLYRQAPTVRRVALAGLAVPALLSMWAWSNPTRFLSRFAGVESTTLAMRGGPNFIFGSYPDDQRLHELKKQGVTSIVSLQSPSVLVEIEGIKAEREAAAREHLPFIEAPMLPWVSDNTESLEKIKQLALHGAGTYYVHCGLGRDRVNIARRVIEALQPNAKLVSAGDVKGAIGFDRRTEPFERGMLMKIADGAWVIPYPNSDEFYGFVLQGQPGHVFLVLDPTDSTERTWIADAQKQLAQYAVPHTVIAYPGAKGDTSTAGVLAQVRAQKPPFTVIVSKTGWNLGLPKSKYPVELAIAKAYKVKIEPPPKVVAKTAGETPDLVREPGVPPPPTPKKP